MSQIEETLSRISKMGGVEGYVITDGDGNVVRQSKSFTDEVAASYAGEIVKLTKRARHFVRDLDPKVRRRFARARLLPLPAAGAARPARTPAIGFQAHPLSLSSPPSLVSLAALMARLQNDLKFFRLRVKGNREILAAPGANSLVIVVQTWRSSTDALVEEVVGK
jgi:hypothetical protein